MLSALRSLRLAAGLAALLWPGSVLAGDPDLVAARAAYERGEFVATIEALGRAAQRDQPDAQFELALMHANGFGTVPDLRTASVWMRRAARNGHVEAQFQIAVLTYRGAGVVQDHREAAQWFRSAAEAGHGEAQLQLGLMYERGDGVRQDDIEAHKWLNLAAARIADDRPRQRTIARQARDRIAQRLSPLHLALAHRLASTWGPRTSAPDRLTPR
jgi:TPR repeat protein